MKQISIAIENFNPQAGGAESYAVALANRLIEKGWDVHFLESVGMEIRHRRYFIKLISPDGCLLFGKYSALLLSIENRSKKMYLM